MKPKLLFKTRNQSIQLIEQSISKLEDSLLQNGEYLNIESEEMKLEMTANLGWALLESNKLLNTKVVRGRLNKKERKH